jgi:PHD/YefM family antitoxin component YafN of YafNO toxin-antitoxin module
VGLYGIEGPNSKSYEETMSTITIKTDKPMVLIPIDEYEGLKETIELLAANPKLPEEIKKIKAAMKKGKKISLADLKKKYPVE